jgi:hypothetical protein
VFLKEWIYALEAAIVMGDASELEEQDESEEEVEEESCEEIELDDAASASNGGGLMGSVVEPHVHGEEHQALMNSAEKIVLEEMRKMIDREARHNHTDSTADQSDADNIDYTKLSDADLLKFLRARRLVVADAIKLMKTSVPYRRANNLYNIRITDVLEEVRGGMLHILPEARDKSGRILLVVCPQYYKPSRSPPMNIVRAVMYLLDKAQEDEEVQRLGFTVIVDGKGSKYSNFDPKMPKVLLDGIVSRYPARIGNTIIINMPWFFTLVWAVIRPLLAEKLASRFHLTTADHLPDFVDEASLPPAYGGSYQYDHEEWIKQQFQKEGIPYDLEE